MRSNGRQEQNKILNALRMGLDISFLFSLLIQKSGFPARLPPDTSNPNELGCNGQAAHDLMSALIHESLLFSLLNYCIFVFLGPHSLPE